MDLKNFEALEKKIAVLIEKTISIKKDKEAVEARLAEMYKQNKEAKEHLGKVLRERDFIKQKIDRAMKKLEALNS